ncbi:hypothetical protein KIPB_011899 [Kipferlia bialata]|uniref:Uncharacterized protein n=1 Tax=Kipferlia bialata TaxID=797122 RepID=A0A9K3D5E5_9EUKA|nr:hypothetical protein KIPB_011899 [Kipferlia bialata]|eukprot:g11899.t1
MGRVCAIPDLPDWIWTEKQMIKRFPNLHWCLFHEEEFYALPDSVRVPLDKQKDAEFAVFYQGALRAMATLNLSDKCL